MATAVLQRLLAALLLMSAMYAQAPLQVAVQGRVMDPAGHPVSRAVVALVPATADNRGLRAIPLTRTTAQGRFRLSSQGGKVGLTITAQGFAPHFQNIDLQADQLLPPLQITLRKGGYRVEGVVVPAKGLKPADARLGFSKVSQDSGDQFFAEVKGGSFSVYLAPGSYIAQGQAKGQVGGKKHLEIFSDQKSVKIELQAEPTPASQAVLDWIKAKSIPLKGVVPGEDLEDMQPLKALVGNAKVVALGEATHGTREFFQLKHRMLEFLVKEMGFTVFAIEANLPEAFAVDEYITTGKGDPAKALAGLYFWTWNTEEVLGMIRWMRAWNEDPAHTRKLRFYGFDMQIESVAYAQAKAWLEQMGPKEGATLKGIGERMAKLPRNGREPVPPESRKEWLALSKEVEGVLDRLDARKADLSSRSGEDAFDRQRQNLRVLVQFMTLQAEPPNSFGFRDACMAVNVQWIQKREQGARLVLWAHNGHITFHGMGNSSSASLGSHLRAALGVSYLPIGFAFQEGGFQAMNLDSNEPGLRVFEVKPQTLGTLDSALAQAGHPVIALNLRTLPAHGPVRTWFERAQGTWTIGAGFAQANPSGFLLKAPVIECYDALLFVQKTSAARPVGGRKPGGNVPVRTGTAASPTNLGFEAGTQGWFIPKVEGYTVTCVEVLPKEGTQSLEITYKGEPRANAWTSVMQAVEAAPYRGKKLRVSGWVRTDGASEFQAGLWMRVDRDKGRGFFDNMMNRPITSTEWTEAVIEGLVDENATVLNFGCLAQGMGTGWYDGIKVEILP